MRELNIIVVDDQPEVSHAILRDLSDLVHTQLYAAGSAEEARAAIEDLLDYDEYVAVLIVDCVMPGESGVAFLESLGGRRELRHVRRVMVTGQATHQDTIQAINLGSIQRYIQKPWQADELRQVVREELTRFVLATGEDPQAYDGLMCADLVRDAAAGDFSQV